MLAGWHTAYEPRALVGMQVPTTMRGLWSQRKRWARGQGEVLRVHLGEVSRLRNHRLWLVSLESLASLLWIVVLVASLVLTALAIVFGDGAGLFGFGFGFAWGIAIALVATVQLVVALTLEHSYDPTSLRALLLGPLYPLAYWTISAAAAVHSQTVALLRGPREERVVWDVPREELNSKGGAGGRIR
jgi:biofilm PGA synthesis N-glycosyltransferase PgaC